MKTCNGCGEEKGLSEFYKSDKSKDGKTARCRLCIKTAYYSWRKSNPDRVKEIRNKYYYKDPAARRAATAAWRDKNPGRNAVIALRWRKENPEKHKAGYSRYYNENKEKCAIVSKRCRLRSEYGLTLEDWDSLQKFQDYKCAGCMQPKKLYIDHCHKSGLVRGGLCRECNLSLGHAKDSHETLDRLSAYLKTAGEK